ncbi:hypothetical protein QAD02_006252 [Eretmocerus hayati]|uniref:Uncharacterized protein n=1 Tax=Eretmocerus hayati TaxID=131215 RepID=A0ACC2N4I5_9HYME|nr:hypothetical protein QAD02_006252 [Eretmocerus hayati]
MVAQMIHHLGDFCWDNFGPLSYIKSEGYAAEEHIVETSDGYKLKLHRIKGNTNSTPIFLQHGLLSSSFDWVVGGKKHGALAFLLADEGYDVWMGNSRGNVYSSNHKSRNPNQRTFWNFSWQEMGLYDLPAEINYVKNHTKSNMIYIGHSMGTTMFYVMASAKQDIAKKISVMYSLSPVAFMSNSESPLRMLAPFVDEIQKFSNVLCDIDKTITPQEAFNWSEMYGFVSGKPIIKQLLDAICSTECISFMLRIVGYNENHLDLKLYDDIRSHIPTGVSLKMLTHYAQLMNSGRFAYYDYGSSKNKEKYSMPNPPDVNISKILVPIKLISARNDLLTHSLDILKLKQKLPKVMLDFKVKDPEFNHIDFLYAKNARREVYDHLIHNMKNFK